MEYIVETSTPPNTPQPIGPYNHIAKVGQFISIGGTSGVDPSTGQLAGPDVYSQTKQILESFRIMLDSAGSDLSHVIHRDLGKKLPALAVERDSRWRCAFARAVSID